MRALGVSQITDRSNAMILEEYSAVLNQARQQRAEAIGSGVRKHPVVAVLAGAVFVVAIPLILAGAHQSSSGPVASDVQDVSSLQATLF